MKLLSGLISFVAALGIGSASAQQDLPVGAIGSLSGGGTDWGVATQRGVQLAIDEINAQGGLTVDGKVYKPRLVMYDDQYSGQGGATAATRLVNADGVKFIIGPIGTQSVMSALAVTTPAKVLAFTDGFSPKILSPDSKYNYRISVTTNEFAPPFIAWLKQTFPAAKRVALVGPSDATGQQVFKILTDSYKAAGYDIAFSEKYERGTADFTPLLTRMMVQNADILDLDSSAPADAGLLLKQARQLGFKGKIVQLGGPSIEENINIAGPLAEDFISFDFFDPTTDLGKRFSASYQKKYPGTMSAWAPVMYNGAQILFEAIRRAKSIEVDKVNAEIPKLAGYGTVFGPVRWSGKSAYGIDHQLAIDFLIMQVKNGKPEVVKKVATE